jgi:hypothetical protein
MLATCQLAEVRPGNAYLLVRQPDIEPIRKSEDVLTAINFKRVETLVCLGQ